MAALEESLFENQRTERRKVIALEEADFKIKNLEGQVMYKSRELEVLRNSSYATLHDSRDYTGSPPRTLNKYDSKISLQSAPTIDVRLNESPEQSRRYDNSTYRWEYLK